MPIYEFGDFQLDTGKRLLLHRSGAAATLTPKAFDTLLYLVEHAGGVLGKEELMRAIWPDTAVEENNLTQNISLLRRVLGEGRRENRFIATVPGRGYQFLATVKATRDATGPRPAVSVSIAVLPFANLSADPEYEYLADGLADELITALSRVPGLRVAARTSAFSFKGKQVHIREIAGELAATLVLEGTVRNSGSRMRITVELVNAAEGYQLWSERYDYDIQSRDLFEIQDEITVAVMNALRMELPGGAKGEFNGRRTENARAHELYLKGRFHLFRMSDAGIEAGMRHFEDAIEADPGYAPAYVGLAHAYRMFGLSLERPAAEVGSKAKTAALQAIAIDDTLAEAHAVLAFTSFWYEWGWNVAEQHFRRALALDPNSADTHWMYAHVPSNLGRHGEALALMARARERDPLSGLIHAMEGQFLLHAGRPGEAVTRLEEALDLDPRSRVAHLFASSAYIEEGRFDEAVAEARLSHDLCPSNSSAKAHEACAHARAGRAAQARNILDSLLEIAGKRYLPAYNIALVSNALGQTDRALAFLELSFEQRVPWLAFLSVDPKWRNLRTNPRFLALLGRLDLPKAWPRESSRHRAEE